MLNRCQICQQKTLIFVWSTSRAIDKDKLTELDQFKTVVDVNQQAFPICWACIKKYNLIVGVKDES